MSFNDTGPYAILHYQCDEIWKVYKLKEGLLQGTYIQNGGIESPTLYAQYNQGQLHGYRVITLDYAHRMVSLYNKGLLQFYYRQYRDGHVYEYHGRNKDKIYSIKSHNLCIHCIISKMKQAYKLRHKSQ